MVGLRKFFVAFGVVLADGDSDGISSDLPKPSPRAAGLLSGGGRNEALCKEATVHALEDTQFDEERAAYSPGAPHDLRFNIDLCFLNMG